MNNRHGSIEQKNAQERGSGPKYEWNTVRSEKEHKEG